MTSKTKAERDQLAQQQLAAIDRDQMQAVWAEIDNLARHGATVAIQREAYKARTWLGRIVDRIEAATMPPDAAEQAFTWNDPPPNDSPFPWAEWDQAESLTTD